MEALSADASGKIGLMNLSDELLLMIVEQSNITSCARLSRICSRLNGIANYVLYKPDTNGPDTDEPDTDEHDTDKPDPDKPDTDEPDTDEPDTDEPETEGQETVE